MAGMSNRPPPYGRRRSGRRPCRDWHPVPDPAWSPPDGPGSRPSTARSAESRRDDPLGRPAGPPSVAVDEAPHGDQPRDRVVVVEPIAGRGPARVHDAVAAFPSADRRDVEASAGGCLLDRVHGLVSIPRRQTLDKDWTQRYGSRTARVDKASGTPDRSMRPPHDKETIVMPFRSGIARLLAPAS